MSPSGFSGPSSNANFKNADTQVLAQTFTRTGNGGFLASTGADIAGTVLVGIACVGLGVFFVRRSRAGEKSPPASAA